MSAGVNFSYGGIDLNSVGVGNGVLNRTSGGNARASTGSSATPDQKAGRYERTGASSGDTTMHQGGPGVLAVFLGLLGVAFLLWLVRKNSSHLQQTTLGWNWYNGLSTTLMVGIGFTLLKLAAAKLP